MSLIRLRLARLDGRSHRVAIRWMVFASLAFYAGCAETTPQVAEVESGAAAQVTAVPPRPASAVPPQAAAAQVEPPAAPTPAATLEPVPPPSTPTPIIGRTTQDVRDAAKEQAAGAQKVQPKVTGQDPITVSGSAYTAIIGRTEQLQIKHTLDIFYNLNGRYPRDLDEFMKEIIHANRIRLAQLPYYQKYGYDAAKHELVILEYPH